jgi:4-carboxymuconolactone decarboxylase
VDDPRYEAGMKVRREVLGDEHVDRATANATDFSRPFQEFITRSAWGEAWTRPGLDRKTRSCITLAILTALRAENEIPMHVRAAVRNGLTEEEILEVLIHTAVYAGVPAANSAVAIAQRTLEEGPTGATTSSSHSSAASPSSARSVPTTPSSR